MPMRRANFLCPRSVNMISCRPAIPLSGNLRRQSGKMNMLRLILITTCAVMAVSCFGAATTKTSWPQFRGNCSGVSTETNVLLEWSAEQGVRWHTPIPGRGHSSPVVMDGKIFLTADTEGEVVPGVKAVLHTMGGEPFKHPDAMG